MLRRISSRGFFLSTHVVMATRFVGTSNSNSSRSDIPKSVDTAEKKRMGEGKHKQDEDMDIFKRTNRIIYEAAAAHGNGAGSHGNTMDNGDTSTTAEGAATGAAAASEAQRRRSVLQFTDAFSEAEGRRPRVLLSIFGSNLKSTATTEVTDGPKGETTSTSTNDNSGSEKDHALTPAAIAASAREDRLLAGVLAQLGFDVDLCSVGHAPRSVARQAVEADAHLIHARVESGEVYEAVRVATEMFSALQAEGCGEEVAVGVQRVLPSASAAAVVGGGDHERMKEGGNASQVKKEESEEEERLVFSAGARAVFDEQKSNLEICEAYVRILSAQEEN